MEPLGDLESRLAEYEDSLHRAAGFEQPAQPDDDEIVAAVERELTRDGAVPASIEVTSTEGVVNLRGTVDSILAAERAQQLAELVRGVQVVDDDLVIEPKPVEDLELHQAVLEALYDDITAESYEVEIEVNDGVVTLRGEVDSRVEHDHAERLAKGVTGVRAVTNDLDISYPLERTDFEIEKDIETRLRWDALVSHRFIDVDVDDAEVFLEGSVGSAAERRRVIRHAWVIGVDDVDAEELRVEPWAEREHLRDPDEADLDNREIARAIERALAYEPGVLSFQVDASVSNGIATLRGQVDTMIARLAAQALAENTVGVASVHNLIEIEPNPEVTDPQREAAIERALMRSPITERYEIDVEVNRGRATLTGRVDDVSEWNEASAVAMGVEGIWAVDNWLEVDLVSAPAPSPSLRGPSSLPMLRYWPYR